VEIAFDKRVTPYVRTRVWHPSQTLRDSNDGGLVMTLEVCNDLALRSWILGWGASARVLAPAALAADIRADLTNASAQYH
jgi:proteasome accessory factor B